MQLDIQPFRGFGAHGSWDAPTPAWARTAAEYGPWILAGLAVVFLVRALVHARRHRVLTAFGADEQAATHRALLDAEARTTGEIVPVVLERSDEHAGAEWMSALVAAFLATLLLSERIAWDSPREVLSLQLGAGAIGFLLARFVPSWKRMFVTEERASRVAERMAMSEFHRLGLSSTEARTGVLLFVSLFEHRVVVIGDAGIHTRVGAEHWDATRAAILAGIRRGSISSGLCDGIRLCGEVLERHFPWTHGDRNELPDRVVVRRE